MPKLSFRYPTIKKGRKWWKSLSDKDRKAFREGFVKNRNAEKIQKEETNFNILRKK